MTELLIAQLTDVFRMGLLVALWVTMSRTAAVTGKLLPLALGLVFVAVVLPTTMPGATAPLQQAVLTGLLSNAIILAVIALVAAAIKRFRAP